MANTRERGISPQTLIEELEARRREDKLTLNGLQKVVKTMREDAADVKARNTADEGMSGVMAGVEAFGEQTSKKRRAKLHDPRRKRSRQDVSG